MLDGVIDDLQKAGEKVPVPLSERTYSGKFNLRLGEALQREVATQAAEENLSLNQWVVRQLSKGA